ncbi:MAG: DEAD/DEAH box helicase [Candidatus Micrarchaeia archaeon]
MEFDQLNEGTLKQGFEQLGDFVKLIDTTKIEPREYQINIVKKILNGKNTLVILPTGLGKTLIAVLAIANTIYQGKKAIMLAPTKPLSEQHQKTLQNQLLVEQDKIKLITGVSTASKRLELESSAKVIVATPQTIANDIKKERLNIDEIGIVIFDECHRAIGKYAYTYIANVCREHGVQVVGLTASPGSKKEKIDALINTLNIQQIEIRIFSDPDVEKYIMKRDIFYIYVEKSKEINEILSLLKPHIDQHLEILYSHGLSQYKYFEHMPKGKLLEIGNEIKKIQAKNYRFISFFNYIYVLDLVHAYDLVATEGFYPFISYIESLRTKEKKSRAVNSILSNKAVVSAEWIARNELEKGNEHPKMFKLIDIIKKDYSNKKIIIFAQYRSTIKKLDELLNINGIKSKGFVGKKEGITIQQQQEIIRDFRDNKFNVLIATSIGEEGLDIPNVDLVIFYEPIPSEIRNIQRKGRTGRLHFGEVIILITKDTKDETYNIIARMKEKKMHDLVLKVQKELYLGLYYNKNFQKKLQ